MNKQEKAFASKLNVISGKPGGFHFFFHNLREWMPSDNKEFITFKFIYLNSDGARTLDEWYKVVEFCQIRKTRNNLAELSMLIASYHEWANENLENTLQERSVLIQKLSSSYRSVVLKTQDGYLFFGWLIIKFNARYNYLEPIYLEKLMNEGWVNKYYHIAEYRKAVDEVLYLISEYKKHHSNVTLNINHIPKELITSFQQYFLFFNEYIEAVKGENVDLEVKRTSDGLQLVFQENDTTGIDKIKAYLEEFFTLARRVILDKDPIGLVLEQLYMDEFKKIQLEAQISHLQLSLKLKETEIKYLTRENDFLQTLALNFTQHSQASITNQIISDGQQQFGTNIHNLKDPTKGQPED